MTRVMAKGEPRELPEGSSAEDLILQMGLGSKWVVVERNGQPLPRSELASTILADGDRLELVRAVAGG